MQESPILGIDTRVSHISKKEEGLLVDVASQFGTKKYVIPIEDMFPEADKVEITEDYNVRPYKDGFSTEYAVPDFLKPQSARSNGGKRAKR